MATASTAAAADAAEASSAALAASTGCGEAYDYSPPQVDRIWGIWASYYNRPKAIFYLVKGDTILRTRVVYEAI